MEVEDVRAATVTSFQVNIHTPHHKNFATRKYSCCFPHSIDPFCSAGIYIYIYANLKPLRQ